MDLEALYQAYLANLTSPIKDTSIQLLFAEAVSAGYFYQDNITGVYYPAVDITGATINMTPQGYEVTPSPVMQYATPSMSPSLPLPVQEALQTPPPTDYAGSGGVSFSNQAVARLALQNASGTWDTGATYPLCSRENPEGCKPIQFRTLEDVINYTITHGEQGPYVVMSENEAWEIVEGRKPLSQASGGVAVPQGAVSTGGGGLIAAAVAAFFVLKGKL